MKSTCLLLSGLLSLCAASALAHPFEARTMVYPNAMTADERHEVWAARRAVHRDDRALAAQMRDLERDEHIAAIEARDVWRVERLQDQLAARGDLRGAQRLERVRYHEANEATIARRQVSHDRNVIAIERRQLEHDRRVLESARDDR